MCEQGLAEHVFHWLIVSKTQVSIIFVWASLMAQMVKNPPAILKTWVWSLGSEDPLEEGMATHSSILAWRISTDRGAWRSIVHGVAKSQMGLSIAQPSWLTNNVVTVSGEQQRDSATHIHVSILPQTPLPYRLPHNIKQSFICYIVGLFWLSILKVAVCPCQSSQTS